MKNLSTYINEGMSFKLTRNYKKPYSYYPEDTNEFKRLIRKLIDERGLEADLNDIDTSKITDMSNLFTSLTFDGDISSWDVRNVKNMKSMFAGSSFTGKNSDLSEWNVSKVKNMSGMFEETNFDGDLSKWDVSNVKNMISMFERSIFTGDISNWNVNNVENMGWMFADCKKFKGKGLYKWNVSNVKNFEAMFMNCSSFCENLDSWGKLIDFNKIRRSNLDTMFNYVKAPNKPQWYLDYKSNLKK